MTFLTRIAAGLCTSATLIGFLGCDGSTAGRPAVSSSMTKTTVTGKVMHDGKPATKGTITFNGANVERKMVSSGTSDIGPDGSFKLETVIGGNQVTVAGIPGFNPGMNIMAIQQQVEVTEGMAPLELTFPKP